MTVKIGTKYICVSCKSEFIVTKTTPKADLKCCGNTLENK